MKKKIDLYHRDNYVVFLFSFGNFPKKVWTEEKKLTLYVRRTS